MSQLETERLLIRPFELEDAAFLVELLNSPGWLRYIGDRNVRDEAAAETIMKNLYFPAYEKPGLGARVLVRKADGAQLGNTGFYHRPGLDAPDFGFAMLPQFMRRGYAYEAAVRMLEFGRSVGIDHPLAITLPDNVASLRLLEKLGFVPIGSKLLPGDTVELTVLQLR